jgi:hypothetical protein
MVEVLVDKSNQLYFEMLPECIAYHLCYQVLGFLRFEDWLGRKRSRSISQLSRLYNSTE